MATGLPSVHLKHDVQKAKLKKWHLGNGYIQLICVCECVVVYMYGFVYVYMYVYNMRMFV